MRTRLTIGEVAQLLGVTPKAIRHYHKRGLLTEAERSQGGYRLYTAHDLLRLRRIRRLQALGLSLAKIARVLGAPGQPDDEQSLRRVLEELLMANAAQIRALEAQRAHIQTLLADQPLDALERPDATPAILAWVQERLGEDSALAHARVWEQDARIFGSLEAFKWPEEHRQQMRQAAEHLAEWHDQQPEQYQALLQFAERLAALADLPETSPEVERLAEEAVRSGLAQVLAQQPFPAADAPSDPYGDIIAEVMLSALAPAQRRFLEIVRARMAGSGEGGKPA